MRAEGFESGEEVLDAVAVAIEMLVKRRVLRSAGVYGYNGDAAMLVHISTDGVAVVALVHEDTGAGEDKAEWVAQGVTGEMGSWSRDWRESAP